MKTFQIPTLVVCMLMIFSSCEKSEQHATFEDFCKVKPDGWECEIIENNFSLNDIPKNADIPIAIIKFTNPSREFDGFSDSIVNPSLTIDFYVINKKQELLNFIKSQQIFSWCIPIYYGETDDYFILTSPCFINGGSFTEEANSSISDLHEALKSIMTIKDYAELGN
jgi:hypothetical protein